MTLARFEACTWPIVSLHLDIATGVLLIVQYSETRPNDVHRASRDAILGPMTGVDFPIFAFAERQCFG